MNTIVSQKMSRGQGNEFLNKLEAAGLNDELAQRVIDSKGNDLATKVVHLIGNGDFEPSTSQPSTSQERACEIMGTNFFGIEDAIRYFRVNPSRAQIAALSEIPFTEKVLASCKDTHVLVAVFPISILDIRSKVERKLFYNDLVSWYDHEPFAKDRSEIGWRLVRKIPVPDSTSKTWDEQQAFLDKNEETPSAQVVIYTIIGHYLATGERLFENVYVRTSSVRLSGHRFYVGFFGQHGLIIDDWWGNGRHDEIGVFSTRKP